MRQQAHQASPGRPAGRGAERVRRGEQCRGVVPETTLPADPRAALGSPRDLCGVSQEEDSVKAVLFTVVVTLLTLDVGRRTRMQLQQRREAQGRGPGSGRMQGWVQVRRDAGVGSGGAPPTRSLRPPPHMA